ncbi:MAG: PQQ-binding-like beta-propeller repeat protein [Myxococcales bacterium]
MTTIEEFSEVSAKTRESRLCNHPPFRSLLFLSVVVSFVGCGSPAAVVPGILHCQDKVLSGTETDVDCGGGDCDLCSVTKVCKTNADCLSRTCLYGVCRDPDCQIQNGGCDPHASCTQSPGQRTCQCASGWSGDGFTCRDIDECSSHSDDCGAHATCWNRPGSWDCECAEGWELLNKQCVLSIPAEWSFTTGGGIHGPPALAADGSVYVGSADGKVNAVGPGGSLKWSSVVAGAAEYRSPQLAVGADQVLYAVGDVLSALKPDGALKWSYGAKPSFYWPLPPAIGADGTVYFTNGQTDTLDAINPDGTLKWSAEEDLVNTAPALGPDGTIVVGRMLGAVTAVRADGTLRWSYSTGTSDSVDLLAVGADGSVYAATGSLMTALSPDGALKWTTAATDAEIATGPGGDLYVVSDKKLQAFGSDGSLKWSFGLSVARGLAVGPDGTVYVGGSGLVAFTPEGLPKWRFWGEGVHDKPAFGADGTVYVGTWDAKLYAVKP